MSDNELYLEIFNVPTPEAARVLIGVLDEDMDIRDDETLRQSPYDEQIQSYNATRYWSLTADKLQAAGITFTLVYRTAYEGDGEVSCDPVAGRHEEEHGEFGDPLIGHQDVTKILDMTDVAEIHGHVRQIIGQTWAQAVAHWAVDRNPIDDLLHYSNQGRRWVVTKAGLADDLMPGDLLTYYRRNDDDDLVLVRDSDTRVFELAEDDLTPIEEEA